MKNPTIVVLTDRNDLDDQLFTTFGNCKQLLRQTPVQAENIGSEKVAIKAGYTKEGLLKKAVETKERN